MTWKKIGAIGISALALAPGAFGVARAGNLITNGDFTSYVIGPGTPGGGPSQLVNGDGTTTVAEGYTSVTGWTSLASTDGPQYNYTFLYTGPGDTNPSYYPAGGTETYIWGPALGANNGLSMPPGGGNYLAMDGTDNVKTPLQQTISGLTVGQTYQLNFEWAAAEFYAYSGNTTEQFQVSFGSQTQDTIVYQNTPKGFSGWMTQSMDFTANSATQTLSFLSVGTPDSLPPVGLLADVSMQSVPEPGSLVLIGIGLVGAVGVRRLRKKAATGDKV